MPLTVDTNALIQKIKLDHEGTLRLADVLADGVIAMPKPGDGAREAFNGPVLAVGCLYLVDIGEVTGVRPRQAEQIANGLTLAQILVAETQLRILHGSVVIRGMRPGHRRLLRQKKLTTESQRTQRKTQKKSKIRNKHKKAHP